MTADTHAPDLVWHGLSQPEVLKIVGEICDHGTGFVAPLITIVELIDKVLRERNATAPQRVQAPEGGRDEAWLAMAHRIAWRYKKSNDPAHSDTYTFNRDTLLQFARGVVATLAKFDSSSPAEGDAGAVFDSPTLALASELGRRSGAAYAAARTAEPTSGTEREAFLREFTGGTVEYRAWAWQGWQARANVQPKDHVPAGPEIEAAVDAKLGIKLLPPIRVPAVTAGLIEKVAALEGVIVQAIVRDVLVERFSVQGETTQAPAPAPEPVATVMVMGSVNGEQVLGCLIDKQAQASGSVKRGDKLYTAPGGDEALTQALEERDAASDYIDALLDEVLGADRHEWTSAYGHADAMAEVRERMSALLQPMVEKAWDRFEAVIEARAPAPGLTDMQIDKLLNDLDDVALNFGDDLPGLALNSRGLERSRQAVRKAFEDGAPAAAPCAAVKDEQLIPVGFSVEHCSPAGWLTDEANAARRWIVKRNEPPMCDENDNRVWFGPTLADAIGTACKSLGISYVPVQGSQQ